MNRPLMYVLMISALLAITAGPAFSASAFSSDAPSRSLLGLDLGYMTGKTLYHISVYDATGGVESELEFPLNTFLIGLDGSYRSAVQDGHGGIQFDYKWLTNVGSGSGKMKDSDWLTGAPETDPPPNGYGFPAHPGLDIYSESDAKLKAMIIDLRLSADLSTDEQWKFGPLAGLLYERFSYDVSNVSQVGFGPYTPGFTGTMPGPVLTYNVTYILPVFGVRAGLVSDQSFEAQLDLGYSPFASAKDKDDHLLRSKVSEASTTGNAFLATLRAQWELDENNYMTLQGEYLRIRTTGTQSQTFYDGSGLSYSGIDDRIDSDQTSIHLLYTTRL